MNQSYNLTVSLATFALSLVAASGVYAQSTPAQPAAQYIAALSSEYRDIPTVAGGTSSTTREMVLADLAAARLTGEYESLTRDYREAFVPKTNQPAKTREQIMAELVSARANVSDHSLTVETY